MHTLGKKRKVKLGYIIVRSKAKLKADLDSLHAFHESIITIL